MRNRGWTITLNNYSEEEWKTINEKAQLHSEKFVLGKEVGEKGTPHIQGYVYFKNPKDLKGVKKTLGNDRLHLEVAKGNTKQNLDYCIKDGDYTAKGMEEKEKPWVPKNGYELEMVMDIWWDDLRVAIEKSRAAYPPDYSLILENKRKRLAKQAEEKKEDDIDYEINGWD